ncbi:TPA: hypothetical protein HA238_06310 [Candidatus Micrarchaeota archaeon]|nr:hypothetical protein [Candidatus Micrarchaeota archaeon]
MGDEETTVTNAGERPRIELVTPWFSDMSYSKVHRIEEIQAGIKIRCADARELGYLDAIIEYMLANEYVRRGVFTKIDSISTAGSFMTTGTISDIKTGIYSYLDHYALMRRKERLKLFVQISSHGDIVESCDDNNRDTAIDRIFYSYDDVTIEPHSNVNCGMTHAEAVWSELTRTIIEEGKKGNGITIKFPLKETKGEFSGNIDCPEALLQLLKNVYAFTGNTVEEFVSSIGGIIPHVVEQKKKLRNSFKYDPELSRVMITINASVSNFRTGATVRLDGNEDLWTILDDMAIVRRLALERLPPNDPERINRSCNQSECVKVGLICPSATLLSPRTTLAGHLGIDLTGGVFGIIDNKVLHDYSPFGNYKLVAFFYSVSHLPVKDYYVVGGNKIDLDAIKLKIEKDPIISFIIRKFNVKMHYLTTEELKKTEKTQRGYANVVMDVLKDYQPPSKKSVLWRQVINPHPIGKLGIIVSG